MINEEMKMRQQYIKANNELGKKFNTKVYNEGNERKVELDRKLEEISISTGVLVSGNIVRQNILNSTPSSATVLNNTVISTSDSDNDNSDNDSKKIFDNFNKGKDIVNNMKNSLPNVNNNYRFNNINRNI